MRARPLAALCLLLVAGALSAIVLVRGGLVDAEAHLPVVDSVDCSPGPLPPTAAGKEPVRFVSPDGNDDGPGTAVRPWRSLQVALDRLESGATLVLRGTFRGSFVVSHDGTQAAPITIRGAAGDRGVVQGRLKVTSKHIVVADLVFDGRDAPISDTDVYVAGGDDVWLVGNEIRNAPRSGVFAGDGADRITIVGNWIHDNGSSTSLDHGIYLAQGVGGLIEQNLIDHNRAYGIQLYPEADGVVVRRNTLVANNRSGIVVGGRDSATADDNVIVDNTAAFNGEQGIRTSWSGQVGRGNVARNNVAFGNPAGGVGGDGLVVTGTSDVDPLFRDVGARDYRLRAGSAAEGRSASLDTACFTGGR
jgi:hypothetical protein